MTTKKKAENLFPNLGAPPAPLKAQVDGQARAFTVALLDAAGNGCQCGPCQLLRQMGEQLKAQLRPEAPK